MDKKKRIDFLFRDIKERIEDAKKKTLELQKTNPEAAKQFLGRIKKDFLELSKIPDFRIKSRFKLGGKSQEDDIEEKLKKIEADIQYLRDKYET